MNSDWFWPRFKEKTIDENIDSSLNNDIKKIRGALDKFNDDTILDEARRLYDQEQTRRDGADNKAGIYIAAVTALIAFFSSLMPKINNNLNFIDIILFIPFLLALIQLVRSGIWALNTLKITKHYLLGWNDLIKDIDNNKRQFITENLLVALRANYDLNNAKISNLNMSHATLISASVWLLFFIVFKLLSSVYLSIMHGVFLEELLEVIQYMLNSLSELITKSNLSAIGLTFNIIGVVLLWFFVAEIIFSDKKDYIKGIANPTSKEIKFYKLKIIVTRIAMVMIIVGFTFQFISIYFPS